LTEDTVLEWICANRGKLSTSLYLYSADALAAAASRLATLLPAGARLFYSLKANPQPAIVARFAELGCRPEVASTGERRTCTLGGRAPEDVHVGGVSRSAQALAEVCASGCLAVVLDSMAE